MSNSITFSTKAYGRESDLLRLNIGRSNHKLGPLTRRGHDRAHTRISQQLNDPIYCSLRERLMRATIVNDQVASARIELLIRDHLKEPKEAHSGAKQY